MLYIFNMKKTVITLFIFIMLLSACLTAGAERDLDKKQLQLGRSQYFLTVSDDFKTDRIGEDNEEKELVGLYRNVETGLEIAVHERNARGFYSFETFAEKKASEYGVISKKIEINGVKMVSYSYSEKLVNGIPVEEMGGAVYNQDDIVTNNYLVYTFPNGNDCFLQASFKLNELDNEIEAALAILTIEKKQYLQLGTSGLHVYVPAGYEKGDVTEKEISEGLVGYYRSDQSLMDFDVYQIPVEGNIEELSEYVRDESQKRDSGALATSINGIPCAYYYATEQYEEKDYRTLVYVFKDNIDYIKMVFWLDGDSFEEAMDIIDTVWKN